MEYGRDRSSRGPGKKPPLAATRFRAYLNRSQNGKGDVSNLVRIVRQFDSNAENTIRRTISDDIRAKVTFSDWHQRPEGYLRLIPVGSTESQEAFKPPMDFVDNYPGVTYAPLATSGPQFALACLFIITRSPVRSGDLANRQMYKQLYNRSTTTQRGERDPAPETEPSTPLPTSI